LTLFNYSKSIKSKSIPLLISVLEDSGGYTMNRNRLFYIASRIAAGLVMTGMLVFGGTQNVFATLTDGSTFNTADGNLSLDTGEVHDWAAPIEPISCPNTIPGTGANCGTDLSKNAADNAFGQGSKEDIPNPTVVNGSIPPNKSDLTRFYVNKEFINNKFFLYLAWERSNVLGNANMDFEINQVATPGSNGVTPVRTVGDLLVTFDFTQGGGNPVLGLLHWVTSGSTSQCFASNALPCWGNHEDLSSTGEAEGQVNSATVHDPYSPPAGGADLPGLTFGEAGVDLTDAGIFSSSVCEHFGSVYLKSRSSSSFTSELKDFIAPVPINISNCGNIIIRKVTIPSPDPTNTNFAYTTTSPAATPLSPSTFNLANGGKQDYGNKVFAGSYSVSETDPGPQFAFTSLTCSASSVGNGSTTTISGATVNIVLKAGDVIDCTYTNTLEQGAIKIIKTSSKAAATPLAGAVFSIKSGTTAITGSPFTTGSDGTVCVDHLLFGTYSVQETAAPTGYAIDDSTAHTVTVSKTTTCGNGNEATFSATDTPLTDLVVKATSEVSGGTKTTITCVDSGSANIGNSPQGPVDPAQVTANGLKPGTYTCTVVVDP
jgi:hypothetical protein